MRSSSAHISSAGFLMRSLFIGLFIFWASGSFGQNKIIDSLKSALPLSKDREKIRLLNRISKQYWFLHVDSSMKYAQEALSASEALRYNEGIAESYRNMGAAHLFSGNKKTALVNLDKALVLYSSIPEYNGMAATYNNLGVLKANLGEFSSSLKDLDSALILFRRLGDHEGEGSVLNYIGITYQEMGNYQKAIDYCLKGFEIRKKYNDRPGVVFSLINVGNMYLDVGRPETALKFYRESVSYAIQYGMEPVGYSVNQLGKTFLRLKQFDSAEVYLLNKNGLRKEHYADPYLMGQLYYETNRLVAAIEQFRKGLFNAQQIGLPKDNAEARIGLSKVLYRQGEIQEALEHAIQAHKIADSIKSDLVLADASKLLSAIYETKKEYVLSIRYAKEAQAILDSVNTEDYQQKLAFADAGYEIEKEQAKAKILIAERNLQDEKIRRQQFNRNIIIGISTAAILLAVVIIFNINRQRKTLQVLQDKTETQKISIEQAYRELQASQANLIQREKMASLGELAGGIAHEIQNPLNFVNNFSDVNQELIDELKEEADKGNIKEVKIIAESIKENEAKINHHGKRADAIVKGMLQHSRASTGQKEPTDFNTLVDEYLRLAYHGIKAKDKNFNAILEMDYDPQVGKVNIIPQDIGRVLLNLYNNAFYSMSARASAVASASANASSFAEAMAEDSADKSAKAEASLDAKAHMDNSVEAENSYKPTLLIRTRKIADNVEIAIRDNGGGIPERIVDKIFQPFFTTKPTGQGTGLGLSLSYDIIKAHGGEIKVNNIPGEGAEFIISLPVTQE